MRSPNAESVQEAVEQLKTAESVFLFAKGKEAWENFRAHCQQLSQWIEHGRGVTEEMKPDLVKTLFASEKILLENDEYNPRKRQRN